MRTNKTLKYMINVDYSLRTFILLSLQTLITDEPEYFETTSLSSSIA